MKKVVAVISLLVVVSLALATGAYAGQPNWRFNIRADDPTGMNSQTVVLGVYSGAAGPWGMKDPLPSDAPPLSDAQDMRWTALVPTIMGIGGVFPIDTAGTPAMWGRDIKTARMPWEDPYYDSSYPPSYHRKVWSLRIAGCGSATNATIRLQFTTVASVVLPPATLTHPTYGTLAAKYYLKMVDNRGKADAPANGMIWSIPIPTAHTADSYFTLTLPAFNISVGQSELKMIGEGYAMEFYQTAVPEPSSLIALSAGLMALAGFARRRR